MALETMTDPLADAVADALAAVKSSVPSQVPSLSYSGVRVKGVGTYRIGGSVDAAVSSISPAESLAEDSAADGGQLFTLLIGRKGLGAWVEPTNPQVGDIFTMPDGQRLSVIHCADVRGLFFRVEARSC